MTNIPALIILLGKKNKKNIICISVIINQLKKYSVALKLKIELKDLTGPEMLKYKLLNFQFYLTSDQRIDQLSELKIVYTTFKGGSKFCFLQMTSLYEACKISA